MTVSRVFPFRRPVAAPRVRLICLPYAGGSASLFRLWPRELPPDVEVCAVELPARGLRFNDPPIADMITLCDQVGEAIAPLADGVPLSLFGHSMGARIAFELARRLAGRVAHLFVSGSPAPGLAPRYSAGDDHRPTAELSDAELTHRLRALGGTPPEILADAALMVRVLAIVRADFGLIEGYRVAPGTRVACPITVFAGAHDPTTSPATIGAWELRTAGAFRLIELDAGHFYLDTHRTALIDAIQRTLGAPALQGDAA